MSELQQKFSDALKYIEEAQAARPALFQDLAVDAFDKFRRSVLACTTHAPEAFDGISRIVKLNVFDFLVKCSARKARKAQVAEVLGFLLRTKLWARAVVASQEAAELRASLIELLKGHPNLLEILNTPLEEFGDAPQSPSKNKKGQLSAEQKESLGCYLTAGIEAMRDAHWVYQTGVHTEEASDKAIKGFRSFCTGISRMDAAKATVPGAGDVLQILTDDWPNMLQFLASLYHGRQAHRAQVEYVVKKLSAFSPSFRAALDQQTDSPWVQIGHTRERTCHDQDELCNKVQVALAKASREIESI
jgi:hypothetical protein